MPSGEHIGLVLIIRRHVLDISIFTKGKVCYYFDNFTINWVDT